MKTSDGPIIVEETYKTSIANVWRAITELDQMKKWYFENIPSFKAEVGFETEFDVVSEDRIFPHNWKITEVIQNKIIAYDWKFENYVGDSSVAFELFEENESTKLRLTVITKEDFPDDVPEFKRESCIGGWNYFLTERLKSYLETDNK